MRRTAAALSLLVLLTGCSTGESGGSTAARSSIAGGEVAAAPAVAEQKDAVAALPRSLVRTAELNVRVPDARRAVTRVEGIVRAAGGEVANEDLDATGPDAAGQLLLLVPPDRLGAVLDDLAALGDEQQRRLGSEDVTEQVVDLQSRLATQRASVARVRALLARATSLADVVAVESELTKRQADLESLEARDRTLGDQVAMARVTLQLTTAERRPAPAARVGFSRGLHGGWHALLGALRVAGATTGALLPFVPVLLVAAGAVWSVRRRGATA